MRFNVKQKTIIIALIFSSTILKNLFSGENKRGKRRAYHRQMVFYDNKSVNEQNDLNLASSPLRKAQKSTVPIPLRHDYTFSPKGNLEVTYKNLQTVEVYRALQPNGHKPIVTYVYFVKTAQE